jgi:AcrR family transcriptional regulator
MPRLSETARAARREGLMDAARARLAEGSFSDLTVEEICVAAGVSKGSFYVYFPSKAELLLALLDDDMHALDETAAAHAEGDLSGPERFRRFARAALEHAEEPARAQLRADLWAAIRSDPALQERFRQRVEQRRRLVRDLLEPSIRVHELPPVRANALASIVLALAEGLLLHRALDPDGFRWERIRAAIEVLVDGLERASAR